MNEDDTFEALRKPLTPDETVFGRKRWVYCSQHMRPHTTGWCSVSPRLKIALEAMSGEEAYKECTDRDFPLYKDL